LGKKCLVRLYKSVLSTGRDAKATFESIKANASMAVSFISNASVVKLTSETDVDLKNFDEIPTALFIIIDNDRPNLKNITNIYLKKTIRAITSKQERGNNDDVRPIYLIGDEIGNIPPIFNLDGLLTTCLYKKIYAMLIFQDKQQLTDRYGENGSIIANNCDLSVIIKVKNINQAKEWSSAFGTYTAKKSTTTKGADGKVSKTTAEFEKDIITAGELLKLYPDILV
jgi:type IV secretion system protein VirD4